MIDVQRIVRDCPHNDRAVDGKGIVYDFDVLVDGEVRATFRKESGPVWAGEYRYRLLAPDGYPIFDGILGADEHRNERVDGVRARTKADFVPIVEGLLLANRIPPRSDVEAREAAWGRAILEVREVEAAKVRANRIARHATALFDVLEAIEAHCRVSPEIRGLPNGAKRPAHVEEGRLLRERQVAVLEAVRADVADGARLAAEAAAAYSSNREEEVAVARFLREHAA